MCYLLENKTWINSISSIVGWYTDLASYLYTGRCIEYGSISIELFWAQKESTVVFVGAWSNHYCSHCPSLRVKYKARP